MKLTRRIAITMAIATQHGTAGDAGFWLGFCSSSVLSSLPLFCMSSPRLPFLFSIAQFSKLLEIGLTVDDRFCSRRRRRNRYAMPMTSQAPLGGYNSGYGNGNQQYGPPPGPPPQYGNPHGNTGYDGYYGQQSGVAQPQNAYKP
jgi:hypothetical protein